MGDGTTTNRTTPVQVLGAASPAFLTGVADVAAAGNGIHTLALKSDGTVWAWGPNTNGQLGDNSTTQRTAPVQVQGTGGTGFLTGIIAVSAGAGHSVAAKSDGTVWAWGLNGNGQLGDNTTTQRTAPVQVLGPGNSGFLTGMIGVAAGNSHSVAVKGDGTVWAWGLNDTGQLGNGSTSQSIIPVQVLVPGGASPLTGVTAVSASRAAVPPTSPAPS
ncbi:MAG: hypothetical protein NTZ05_00950 [Chloroflexi bacterium]|nr:hypothetical protein [Chloroflexota bacterium]